MAALSCHGFAAANLRISNNLEIVAEVCNTLVVESQKQLEVLKSVDLPDQAKVVGLNLALNLKPQVLPTHLL